MDVILEVQRGSKRTPSIRLRHEETIVGRRDGCDVRIPSSAVSRRHCRLLFRNDYLTVEDLDSANGTFLNGARVTRREVVRPGDLLEIGPVTFLVKYQLTQAAIDHLLQGDSEEDLEEVSDVELVDNEKSPVAVSSDQNKKGGKKEKRTTRRKTTKREPAPTDESGEPASHPEEPDEGPPAVVLDDEARLNLPADVDLRDILSKMEEDS